MLRQRVITAVALVGMVLFSIFGLSAPALAVGFWLLAAIGGYEWAHLAGLRSRSQKMAFVALFGLIAWLFYGRVDVYEDMLRLGCGVWFFAAITVLMAPRGQRAFTSRGFMILLGLSVLLPAWVALVVIRDQPQGQLWLLWCLCIAVAADVGAYFTGRRFGRHKLAPAVSPGKTWEGAVGGMAVAMLVCGLGAVALGERSLSWLLIIAALVVVSIFGDLFESVMKRVAGVKDSGTILPGHGGVLDRIDSQLAILPVFALILAS
ncbi:MAG: phosphatidate cytidylyltransferase [Gammaproteobacteria bacterium]|jgi:phosphatidate cytidylyltransferase|nr:phosphatidate cytidylyltransferase [Gammaproteobacteria bacterium]